MKTNGSHFLVYAAEQGGKFEMYGRVSRPEYERIKAERRITLADWAVGTIEHVEPSFLMLLYCEDNYDYVLGRSRDDILRVDEVHDFKDGE